MAKLYDGYEGGRPIRGKPFADKPLAELIDKLNLRKSDRKSDIAVPPPTFRRQGSKQNLDDFREPSAVFVQVEEADITKQKGWKSGWYLVLKYPDETRKLLDKK